MNEQQDISPQGKGKPREDLRREKLAGYFFDLSKLSYAGMVVGFIMPLITQGWNVAIFVVVFVGVLAAVTSAIIANLILKG